MMMSTGREFTTEDDLPRHAPTASRSSKVRRGKHVILVHGKVYAATSSAEVRRLFDTVVRDFPDETPTLAYVPRGDALVLELH